MSKEDEFLKEENLRLKRAVDELQRLNQLAQEIGVSEDTKSIMEQIIQCSRTWVDAEQAVINVRSESPGVSMETLVRSVRTSSEHEKFHLNHYLIGWMHENKSPFLSNSPRTDARLRRMTPDESICSILCVPLMVRAVLIGVLTVYNKRSAKGFTDDDQHLLSIIAQQSAQVIENAVLFDKSKKLTRIERELDIAARTQQDILPKDAPRIQGYDIAGKNKPAQEVGGDYFDFIPIDDHRVAICLGDVSGKGFPAALLMFNLQAMIRSQTLSDFGASELMRRSNRLLCGSTNRETFVTLFYGVLDAGAHEFRFSNAGHLNPILFSQGTSPKRLAAGGLVLGVRDDFPFEEDRIRFGKGDLLVVFSDGITEAFDINDNQFGEEKLVEFINENRGETAHMLTKRLIEAVEEHAIGMPQSDDLTVVVVRGVEA